MWQWISSGMLGAASRTRKVSSAIPSSTACSSAVDDAQPVDRAATRQFADDSAQERRFRPRRVVGTEDHREPLGLGIGGQFEGALRRYVSSSMPLSL